MKIGIATMMGGYEHARVLDSVLADALKVRGAQPELILCDAALPACQMTKLSRFSMEEFVEKGQQSYCQTCFTKGVGPLGRLGHPVQMFSNYLTVDDRNRAVDVAANTPLSHIEGLRFMGVAIGEHAMAGTLRYLARGELAGEPLEEIILRRYVEAGMLTTLGAERLIRQRGYDVIVANHGIYAPQGLIVETARALGVRVVTYNPAYRRHSFVFSHDESYHFSMITEPVAMWDSIALTPAIEADLTRYLQSRRAGSNDWIWFHNEPDENHARVLLRLGADPAKPYVTALTSVIWDAQLHYEASAFPRMMDWVLTTVRHWATRDDDLQLIIRVHPAEARGAVPSRQRVTDELRAEFGEILPRNVFLVAPDDEASTYALCDNANAVVIYNTKTGVETAAAGNKVIVAGEAWLRGKGIARDAKSRGDYERILATLPYRNSKTDGELLNRAKRYAYHFFFRRMIPLPFIHQDGKAQLRLDISGQQDLKPGRWHGLDVICDGIMYQHPFIYPAETMAAAFGHEDLPASEYEASA